MKRTIALLLSLLLLLGCSAAFATDNSSVYDEEVLAKWPEKVQTYLRYFADITQYPHPSYHEEKLAEYLSDWATELGFENEIDEKGNVIMYKDATPGYEDAPVVILQCHIDMVPAVDEGVEHDFQNDPLTLIWTDNTLTADGTSLGADNGTGIAAVMYLLTLEDWDHGPLRVIYTVEEEVGLGGAHAVDPAWLEGATYMINVDGGYGGAIISCAGGSYFNFEHEAEWVDVAEGSVGYSLSFRDFKGGHSAGVGGGKANGIVTAADALLYLTLSGIEYQLVSMVGGNALNAIPVSCAVTIVVAEEDVEAVDEALAEWAAVFDSSYSATETEYTFTYGVADEVPELALDADLSAVFAGLITVVPNNIHTLLATASGTESSSNIGAVSVNEETISFTAFMRSSSKYQTLQITQINIMLAAMADFDMTIPTSFASWPLKPGSKLVEICQELYLEMTGNEFRVSAIHAGVECGEFAEKNDDLDIISTGVSGGSAGHTTAETLTFDLIEASLDFLEALITKLAE